MDLKSGPIPLYFQLQNILRTKIRTGQLRPGDFFPSENELGKGFNVSRLTVRHAKSELLKEGLITNIRGKGTIVSPNKSWEKNTIIVTSIEDIIKGATYTRFNMLEFKQVNPDQFVKDRLQLPPSDLVFRVEGIREVEEGPISHVITYLPNEIGKHIPWEEVTQSPLLFLIEKYCKVEIFEGIQHTYASLADKDLALKLNIKVGDPVLYIERLYFADGSERKPVELVTARFRADRYHHTTRILRRL